MNRRERRAAAAQQKGAGKRAAIDRANAELRALNSSLPEELCNALVDGERLTVLEILAEGRTPEKVYEVADNASAYARIMLKKVEEMIERPPLACKKGCSWCCYNRVDASIPEVLLIAKHLRETLSESDLVALRERIRGTTEQIAKMTIEERVAAQVPCALLRNGECSVHDVRPLTCRAWNSFDAWHCEQAFRGAGTGAPVFVQQLAVYKFIGAGMTKGLHESDLGVDVVELTRGLAIALETTDVAERWLAGERMFDPARVSYVENGTLVITA